MPSHRAKNTLAPVHLNTRGQDQSLPRPGQSPRWTRCSRQNGCTSVETLRALHPPRNTRPSHDFSLSGDLCHFQPRQWVWYIIILADYDEQQHTINSRLPKRKTFPITGHAGTAGELSYSSTLSLTSALDGVGGQSHAPAALSLGKTRYPLYCTRVRVGPWVWTGTEKPSGHHDSIPGPSNP